tara:strand:+ start:442 stop:837 length:396 start_codon:yes stop_codon:yes gene_type:complete
MARKKKKKKTRTSTYIQKKPTVIRARKKKGAKQVTPPSVAARRALLMADVFDLPAAGSMSTRGKHIRKAAAAMKGEPYFHIGLGKHAKTKHAQEIRRALLAVGSGAGKRGTAKTHSSFDAAINADRKRRGR